MSSAKMLLYANSDQEYSLTRYSHRQSPTSLRLTSCDHQGQGNIGTFPQSYPQSRGTNALDDPKNSNIFCTLI